MKMRTLGRAVIATKFGWDHEGIAASGPARNLNSRPTHIKQVADAETRRPIEHTTGETRLPRGAQLRPHWLIRESVCNSTP